MKLLKISSLSLFILLAFIFAFPIYAAGTPLTLNSPVPISVVPSGIGVINAKIISQTGPIFKISFDITNKDKAQAGIKYSVKLVGESASGQYVADEYVYPEILSLSPNTVLNKDISYTAPQTLSGSYTLVVTVSNSSGLLQGLAVAGLIKNVSALSSLEILSGTCYLSVSGEKGNIKYSLAQGVDIGTNENILLDCTAVNHSKTNISSVPSYETHYRTVSGDIVAQTGGDFAPIVFKGGETKNISLTLSKATKPQAYEVKVSLTSSGISSNSIISRYVLRGESATIQNFSLDKDYYKSGDIAKISISWSPSSDGFSGNRLGAKTLINTSLKVIITDDKNKECTPTINQILTKTGDIELNIPVIRNCNNPIATIELTDANGNILDQKILSFESKTQIKKSGVEIILIIFGVLIVAGLAIYFINLKKKGYAENNLSKSNETNIQ